MKNDGSDSLNNKKKSSKVANVSLMKSEKKYQPNICVIERTLQLFPCIYLTFVFFDSVLHSVIYTFVCFHGTHTGNWRKKNTENWNIEMRTSNETKKENALKINAGHQRT